MSGEPVPADSKIIVFVFLGEFAVQKGGGGWGGGGQTSPPPPLFDHQVTQPDRSQTADGGSCVLEMDGRFS